MNAWMMTGTDVSGALRPSEASTLELCTFEVQEKLVLKAGLCIDDIVFLVLPG